MENYAVPVAPIDANARPVKESRWNRIQNEVNGRSQRNYKHQVSPLLSRSYAEIGEFPHVYHSRREAPCLTHYCQITYARTLHNLFSENGPNEVSLTEAGFVGRDSETIMFKMGVSALEFDTKGTNLVSVTRCGCLMLHKFESLCGHSNESDDQLKHFHLFDRKYDSISAVRWNPSNQYEIAHTSLKSRRLTIFDIEHSRVINSAILKKRLDREKKELSDIAFMNDGIRIFASDTSGTINMWDRRVSDFPQRLLTTTKTTGLTSIQILGDQCVYGAGRTGFIYVWDLRRMRSGRSSTDSQSVREVHSIPLTSINLAYLVGQINPRKVRSRHDHLRPKELQAININPSCPYQLAFHLDDGWSGVVDTHNYQVSHIHCPRFPLWLDKHVLQKPISSSRKSSWLRECLIYAAPSTFRKGLHLLDFYPHRSSPCHVDYDDHTESVFNIFEPERSIFVPLSKNVTACAVHPLNGTIVAGTLDASLLTISQKHIGKKGDGDDVVQS